MDKENLSRPATVLAIIVGVCGMLISAVLTLAGLIVFTPFFLFRWLKIWGVSFIGLVIFYYFVVGIPLMTLGYISHPYDHMTELAFIIIAILTCLVSLISTISSYKEALHR